MASVPYCQSVTVDSFPSTAEEEMTPSDTLTVDDWREEQCRDKTINRVINIMRDGFRPRGERIRREPLQVQKFLRVYKKLILVDGVLYKTSFMRAIRSGYWFCQGRCGMLLYRAYMMTWDILGRTRPYGLPNKGITGQEWSKI